MKYKLWVRRMSISAPKVIFKSYLPWLLKAIFVVLAVDFGGALAMSIYDLWRDSAGHKPSVSMRQLAESNIKINALTAEWDLFSTTVNATES